MMHGQKNNKKTFLFACCMISFIIPVQKLTSPPWLSPTFFDNVVPLYRGFQTPGL